MTEIETQSQSALVAVTEEQAWLALTDGAHTVEGGELEEKDALIGIPFVATLVTIRRGDYLHGMLDKNEKLIEGTGCGFKHPYASLNVVTGPQSHIDRAYARMLRRSETPVEPPSVGPLEDLVINFAGTGGYRQVLEYAEGIELLVFPEGPKIAGFGECKYDSLPSQWEITDTFGNSGGTWEYDREGDPVVTFPIRLHCPRGLRVSTYENQYTKEGRTHYFG